MAITADGYFPFDSGPGADSTEANWRLMATAWLSSGVVNDEYTVASGIGLLEVTDVGGMAVEVGAGQAWIVGHFGAWIGASTLAIASAASIPGGQTRLDRIVARVDIDNNRLELDVLTGTPDATPDRPALTQSTGSIWEVGLAVIGPLDNTTTNIDSSLITDERPVAGAGASAENSRASAQSSIGDAGDITGTGLVFFAQPGRRYRFTVENLGFQPDTNGDKWEIRVLLDSVQIGTVGASGVASSGATFYASGSVRFDPGEGVHQLNVVTHRAFGSGTLLTITTANNPVQVDVVDIGPTPA